MLADSSETSVAIYKIRTRPLSQYSILSIRGRENLKSHLVNLDTIPYLANSHPATNNVIAGRVCDGKNISNNLRASNFVVDRALKSVSHT